MATECQKPLGSQGHVAVEGGGVEGDFEAVVIAFTANEGDDIIRSAVALNLQ